MLSQAVGYAATALGHIAAAGGKPVSIKEVSAAADIPAPYLAKIVNALAHRGLVHTQRGIGGGVTLARQPAQISLYDLCEALGDASVQQRCMMGTAECSDERACPCHAFWVDQRARQVRFLKNATIADVASFETRKRWRAGGKSA